MRNALGLGILIILLLLGGCNPGERMLDLEHQNRSLRTELERERYLRWRLQAYIDSTLGGGSSLLLEKIASYQPSVRLDTLTVRDTLTQERLMPLTYPETERIAQELEEMLGKQIPRKVRVKHTRNEIKLSIEEKTLFEEGSARLSSDGLSFIKKLGRQLGAEKDLMLTVEGHIDRVPGSKDADQLDSWEVSLTRSLAVTRALSEAGINRNRLRVAGSGSFRPLTDNLSEAGRYLNRRTEIYLVNSGE